MPVSAVMPADTRPPGFTRLCHSNSTSPARAPITATSMMRCRPGAQPVVSTSTNATGASGETVQLSSIHVVLSSVYLSKACSDLSRPMPDCLKPPKGTVMSSAS